VRASGSRVVVEHDARGGDVRLEGKRAWEYSSVERQRGKRRIGDRAAAVQRRAIRRIALARRRVMMVVCGRRGRRLVVVMMQRIALVAVGLHDAMVMTEHERRGGKCRHLAGQPDRRDEPDVCADAHHRRAYQGVSSASRAPASRRPSRRPGCRNTPAGPRWRGPRPCNDEAPRRPSCYSAPPPARRRPRG
jgi:hypothetical protein